MNWYIEDTTLHIETEENCCSFEAHAEAPRPSLLGWGVSAGGRHWSSRDPEIPIEAHTSVQEVAVQDGRAAWYTQEFRPNGADYKITKNANIYIGDLRTGEQKQVYKGECYGDLCFDGDELYFNTGNKIAVLDLQSGEVTVLFKHSGIKKNGVALHVTDKRIDFIHWTHNDTFFMWYDRATGEVVNPHINIGRHCYLNDDTVVYQALYHTWVLDTETKKKKRFFTARQHRSALQFVCGFLELPVEEFAENAIVKLIAYEEGRLYFNIRSSYRSQEFRHILNASVTEAEERGLPWCFQAEFSCDTNGKDLRMAVTKEQITITQDEDKSIRRMRAVLHEGMW